jgi:Protein of unknown function (DUF3253)
MSENVTSSDSPAVDTILALCQQRGVDKTICPTDAAKALAHRRGLDELGWRSVLSEIRQTAVALARQGRLVIFRKGRPVDPDDFRGVYRLGLPRSE